MKNLIPLLSFGVALLSACTLVEVEKPEDSGEQTSSTMQEESVRETSNVTYTGIVQPAGISIYQQGSHRLVLPGGKFILLESDTLDLNGYVEEEARVFGALRPTVEAGGMIMRVERIELVSSSSDASSQNSSGESRTSSSAQSSATSLSSDFESFSSTATSKSAALSSAAATSVSSVATSSSGTPDAAFQERVEIMARQEYAAVNWTQQYCSSHVGFCVPVHRNFWFKSFGATDTTLWHVEISSEPVENMHDGPIVMELFAGSAANNDGTVDIAGGKAVAYKEWTFGRHFRISGDASLEVPIRYIMNHIAEYAQ